MAQEFGKTSLLAPSSPLTQREMFSVVFDEWAAAEAVAVARKAHHWTCYAQVLGYDY